MHGTNSPIHPSHADAMKFYTSDRVIATIGDELTLECEKIEGTVIRRHTSEGFYWVRFPNRFNGHCLPLRWNQLKRITL